MAVASEGCGGAITVLWASGYRWGCRTNHPQNSWSPAPSLGILMIPWGSFVVCLATSGSPYPREREGWRTCWGWGMMVVADSRTAQVVAAAVGGVVVVVVVGVVGGSFGVGVGEGVGWGPGHRWRRHRCQDHRQLLLPGTRSS